jgi:DNA polymerase-3 subunit delta
MAVDELEAALAEIKAGKARPLYLVHGEEFLARRAAEALCEGLVPPEKRDFNFTHLDAGAGAREVAQNLDTVPMFRGTKVVFVEGADVLLAKRDLAKELARAKELWAQPARRKDAARRVLAIVAPAGWTWRELDLDAPGAPSKTKWKKEVGIEPGEDKAFFAEVARFCAEQELKAPKDDAESLQKAVTAGPPKGNHLVLLCEEFDDKHPVAKAVADKGLVLERGVDKTPKGRGIDAFDIDALAHEVLDPLKKKITPTAQRALKDRIGPAMRQTAMELEKLAIYVGDRATIDERDVELLVAPLREEEYYELGNALGDGDAERALKLLDEELLRGKHALLLLGGLAASVRRMAVDAAKFAKIPGCLAGRELSYRDFESGVWPAFQQVAGGAARGSPFPVYMSYKRARRHGVRKLLRALALCAEVDAALKRGADGRLALERLVLAVCAPAA